MTLFIWLLGGCGILANFLIYQQKDRETLLLTKLIADCLWTAHYALLGAWSGCAVCGIGIIRESIFLNAHKKWASGKKWLLLFLILSIFSAIVTWKNPFSLLPAIASALSVFSFWKGEPKLTKYLSFPISACFMTYNIACLSYTGIINETFVLISTVIGVIQMKKNW